MKIGKQTAPFSAIATSDADSITVRGKDLCNDLIGKLSYTDYYYFLLTGSMPTEEQSFFTDAVLVAIAEHGLVPSNQAARMTLAAAPDALQGAVAAGLLGCGSVVFGSSESCGRFLVELIEKAKLNSEPSKQVVRQALGELRATKRTVPGYGHPQHSGMDPRATRLLNLAKSRGVAGEHIAMLELVETLLPEVFSRTLPINVSGAIPAVMLDVGFPLGALKGIPILARTGGLLAHLYEEMNRPIGFIMAGHAAQSIEYDGPRT